MVTGCGLNKKLRKGRVMAGQEYFPANDKGREEREWEEKDRESRELKITENTGLVYSIIRRFAGRGCEMEDLFQIGMMGLIKAVDNFDGNFQVKFSTYAVPLITGEIKRYLRDNSVLHVSRTLKENGWKAKKAAEELAMKLGRDATLEEIAAATEMKAEDIVMAMEANAGVESLYRPTFGTDGKEFSLMDRIADGEGAGSSADFREGDLEKEKILDRMLLRQLLSELEPREKRLIHLRYFEERTQAEAAEELGVSQVQVSRLEKRILEKMKKRAEA